MENSINNLWAHIDILESAAPSPNGKFGSALDIYDDKIVVGTLWENGFNGGVYIYKNDGSDNWQHIHTFADPTSGSDQLGTSVSIYEDLVLIGAKHYNNDWIGAAFLYEYDGSSWTLVKQFEPINDPNILGEYATIFGSSVSIDGKTIVIGAPSSHGTLREEAGAAFVYTNFYNDWILEDKILPDNLHLSNQEFGIQVKVKDDLMTIGSTGSGHSITGPGYIDVYERNSNNKWIRIDKLYSSAGLDDGLFGLSIATDGNYIISGDHRADTSNGAAYIFKR